MVTLQNQDRETGGARSWEILGVWRAINAGAGSIRSCPWALMLRTLGDSFRAVAGEMTAPGFRYGQLGALIRKPSPVEDIAQ